jgi:hypothetical protein
MKRLATAFLLALLALPMGVQAQNVNEITLKEAFDVDPDSLQFIADNLASLDEDQIDDILRSSFRDSTIRFTAVLLSDPLNSGQASFNDRVGRVHVWMRDTSAVQNGVLLPGYTAQIVDGDYENTGLTTLAPGAVVTVTGTVTYFGTGAQITPTTIEVVAQDLTQIGLSEMLLDPITVTVDDLAVAGIADANANFNQSALNVLNYNLYAYEYIRLESVRVSNTASFGGGDRFNISFTNEDDLTIDFQGYSLNFRNDRGDDYRNAGFNVPADDFAPPAIGSTVRVQGFMLPSTGDFTNRYNPDYKLEILPFERTDLEVLVTPPQFTDVTVPSFTSGAEALDVTADIVSDASRSITDVTLSYSIVDASGTITDTRTVDMTAGTGVTYTATIPAADLSDDSFLIVTISATDDTGAESTTRAEYVYVRSSEITSIAQIKSILFRNPGASGSLSFTTDLFNLTAVVTSMPDTSGYILLQDDPNLGPNSGVLVRTQDNVESLMRGDQITITSAQLGEFRGATQLQDLEFTADGQVTPYGYVTLTTEQLQDEDVAESYENMLVRFENVAVLSTDDGFGEFRIGDWGDTDGILVDGASSALPDTLNRRYTVDSGFSSIQGIFTTTFNNYKLLPEVESDIVATATSNDEVTGTQGFVLQPARPNPSRGVTTLGFSLERSAEVSLAVYDLMGRRVAVVASGVRPAGSQSVAFDASNLSSGLYLIRLQSGSQVATQQLVVLR